MTIHIITTDTTTVITHTTIITHITILTPDRIYTHLVFTHSDSTEDTTMVTVVITMATMVLTMATAVIMVMADIGGIECG